MTKYQKDLILFLFFMFITLINISFFFYIKNETHYDKIKLNILQNELEKEKHNLSIQKALFHKKYSLQNLQNLAKDRLNLQFSNVNQIIDFDDIIKKSIESD